MDSKSLATTEQLMLRLFDGAHYSAQIEKVRASADLFGHYLTKGAMLGLSPHPDFSYSAYTQLNPDIPTDPIAAFRHYAKYGREERRYATFEQLERDASLVSLSGLFDREGYGLLNPFDRRRYPNEIAHYLTRGWKARQRPNAEFDQDFYTKYYPDAQRSVLPPFVHFLTRNRGGRTRLQNERQARLDVDILLKSGLLDLDFYIDSYSDIIPPDLDPAIHFATAGQQMRLRGSQGFSIDNYLTLYPDLRHLERPSIHYALNGKSEKRLGDVEHQQNVSNGAINFDHEKPNLLLALHEASRTGAPILGHNLAQHLCRRFNIIIWLKKSGVIETSLVRHASAVVTWKDHRTESAALANVVKAYNIDAAILNSAVCHSLSAKLYEMKIPIISLVHEFADYVLPRGTLSKMVMYSERVVCPGEVIADSIKAECISYLGWAPRHIDTRPQGHCSVPPEAGENDNPPEIKLPQPLAAALEKHPGRPVILGAGWIHMRKGVDLFIQIAELYRRLIDKNALFVWVGGGYRPQDDLHYSVWLKSHVERAGLDETVMFVEEQPSLDPFYQVADAFLMCSRLDPFPNVAIDANINGLPVVAFDKTTAYAESLQQNPDHGRVIPFLDIGAAAVALSDLIAAHRKDPGLRDAIRMSARDVFQFSDYSDFLAREVERAIANVTRKNDQAEKLDASPALDPDFFRSGLVNSGLRHLWGTSPNYLLLDLAEKGIFPAKPRPGMNLANICCRGTTRSVFDWLADGRHHFTHPVHYLNSELPDPDNSISFPKSISAHVHAYGTDGLLDIVNPLLESSCPIDVYITTDSEAKLEIIRAALPGKLDHVHLIVTPNRGRDIGPFLLGLPDEFWISEVIGHFHVKGSHHLDQEMTRQWKEFIKTHLYSGETVLHQIMSLFVRDSSLGLLFAEDPCQIGWTKNGLEAQQLAQRIGVEIDLDRAPTFPIGNMFWARSRALLPLRNLQLSWDDMPKEPLPSDGSMLHALERLTPSICERAGLHWATVRYPYAERYTSD